MEMIDVVVVDGMKRMMMMGESWVEEGRSTKLPSRLNARTVTSLDHWGEAGVKRLLNQTRP